MSLKEAEKKIYKKEGESFSQLNRPVESNSRFNEESPFSGTSFDVSKLNENKEIWIKEQEEEKEKRKKIIKKTSIILGAFVVVAVAVWLALYVRKTSFSSDKVRVSVSAPERVNSGESVSIDIDYQNLNRASLKDAVLYISYSENFKPSGNLQLETEGSTTSKFNIGAISGKASDKVTIQGKFFGVRDALVYVSAKLEYKSSTFNSNFVAEASESVFIASSPLNIEVSGPQNAADGNAISYTITYQNTGQEDFTDLKIKADYPNGFSFVNAEPLAATSNNIWYAGTVAAGQSGQVKINGTIKGSRDEQKTVKVSIGQFGTDNSFVSYAGSESTMKIIGSPLSLSVSVNDKKENIFVNAGDSLLVKVDYRNTGSIALRDAILSVGLDSPILDYSQISILSGKGSFDSAKKVVVWKASDIPELRSLNPGAEGSVSIMLPVKEVVPISSPKDKNFSFSIAASMDSQDIPTPEGANKVVASNAIGVKLNSKLLIGLQGFFNDADIQNSGEIPPKVGTETTFTMRLKVGTVSNDVTDGEIKMVLGPGVSWKNNFKPKNASVKYNDRTNELVWNIGSLSAGSGVVNDSKELVFQLGLVPSQNQVGAYASLVSSSVFSAKDVFTGQALEAKLGEKNTNLEEDLSVGDTGKVSQ